MDVMRQSQLANILGSEASSNSSSTSSIPNGMAASNIPTGMKTYAGRLEDGDLKLEDEVCVCFNAWCPLKGHTYLNKPPTSYWFVSVCMTV